jgi:Holliday junction resolvase
MDLDKLLEDKEFGRKKRVNSKQKGSRFERDIVKFLNERFGNYGKFARTPGSGAFATTHDLPDHIILHEDIIAPKNFQFLIECKNGYDLDLTDLFNFNSQLYKWIQKLEAKSFENAQKWCIIYKKNRNKKVIITNKEVKEEYTPITIVTLNSKDLVNTCFLYEFDEFFNLPDSTFFNFS